MMNKNKGFTLVELLAVIVILAIIALIATPIILNIIEGARKDAAKANALGYERAVNLKIMDGELTGKSIEDNEYDINDLDVTVSGKAPDEGTVTIEGKEVVEYTLRFGEYTVTKTRGGSVAVVKGNSESKDDELSAQEVITELVPSENDEKTSGENGTVENLGQYGIRYRGKDPENYVTFNGETWRIIGIVDGYMKIISEPLKDSSGSMLNLAWDNSTTETQYGKNEWNDASLMKLLNPNYSGTGESLYWNSGKGKCYSGYYNATIDCDFTKTGLKKEAQDMIAEVTWKLGGNDSANVTSKAMYDYERGTKVYEGRKTTWQGKVGLMYPSDYGFAAKEKECTFLGNYDYSTCKNNNWLFKNNSKSYWTLMPYSSFSYYAFHVSSDGHVGNGIDVYHAYGVRVVVNLKENVKIIDGNGSKESPYKLQA